MPLEGESPIKTSDHGLFRLHVEFKGVPVNGVDDWAHDGTGVFSNPETQPEKEESSLQILLCGVSAETEKLLIGTFPEEALSIRARTHSGSRGRSAPRR